MPMDVVKELHKGYVWSWSFQSPEWLFHRYWVWCDFQAVRDNALDDSLNDDFC